jgi:STE24 endopeptidase
VNEDKAARFHRLQRRTVWLSLLLQAIALVALLEGGVSRALRDAAISLTGAPASAPVTVALFTILLVILSETATFPLRFYRTFLLDRRFGLSRAPFRSWLLDHARGLAIGAVFAIAAAQGVYFAIARWPRWWWAASAAGFIAALAILARIAPVVLLPISYRFKPLDREALRSRLAALAIRAGVPVLGAYEWGLGEKTSRANAALVGTGKSRRILLSDTLLAHYTDDEIEVILAHELGHHAHGDIRKGLLVESVLLLVSFVAAAVSLHYLGPVLRLDGPADVAGLPLLLCAWGAVSLAARPASNAWSRRNEHRADRFALRMTGRPDAFVSAMRRMAAQNLAEARPSAMTMWLFHTHPPFEERIKAAASFQEAG